MDTTVNGQNLAPDSPGVNLMPPTVFWTCLVLGGMLEFLFPSDVPLLAAPVRIAAGLGLGIAGFAFMAVAHETFKRIGTAVPTHRPASMIVAQGAYRISRNPMYVGGSAFFVGIGLTVGSPWMLAMFLPLGLYLVLHVVPREEAYMERAFGDAYRQYCRTVRRWL